MSHDSKRIPYPPSTDELGRWMERYGIQKLTFNRAEGRTELKIEASLFATVTFELDATVPVK